MKTATINLSIPRPLLDRVDRQARREALSRSEALREALRTWLDRREAWRNVFALGDRQTARYNLKPRDVTTAIREVRRTT